MILHCQEWLNMLFCMIFTERFLKIRTELYLKIICLMIWSLSEISQNFGITRQGVRDIVERSKVRLAGYEESLGLAKHFQNVRTSAKSVKDDVVSIRESIIKARDAYDLDDDFICSIEKYLKDIEKKTDSILEEF